MTLNIKDPEVHRLARALQRETGETMTRAVAEALKERLAQVKEKGRGKGTAEELLAIGRRCASALKHPPIDDAKLLYDENGLPNDRGHFGGARHLI